MEHDKREPEEETSAESKLERAFDAFLTGTGEDDMERLFGEAEAARLAAHKAEDPQQAARFDPRYLPPTQRRNRKRKKMELTPDPRRLPASERQMAREPSPSLAPRAAAAPDPAELLLLDLDPENTPTVQIPRAEVMAKVMAEGDVAMEAARTEPPLVEGPALDPAAVPEPGGLTRPEEAPSAAGPMADAQRPDGRHLMAVASALADAARHMETEITASLKEGVSSRDLIDLSQGPFENPEEVEAILGAFNAAVDALDEVEGILDLTPDALEEELTEAEVAAIEAAGPITLDDLAPYAAPLPPPTRDVAPTPEDIALHEDPDQEMFGYAPPQEATPPALRMSAAPKPAPAPEGQPLDAFIGEARACTEQRFPLEGAYALQGRVEHMVRIGEELAFGHAKGRLHRALRPGNILIGDYHRVHLDGWLDLDGATDPSRGTTVIDLAEADLAFFHIDDRVDLGAVAMIRGDDKVMVGNPRYLPPEVILGGMEAYDEASEIYAFGLVLYETLGLQPARRGGAISLVLADGAAGKLPAFARIARLLGLPEGVSAVVTKALALAPEDRYFSMEDLLADLRQLRQGDTPSALSPSRMRALRQHCPNILKGAALGGVVMGLGGALAMGLAAPPPAPSAETLSGRAAEAGVIRAEVESRAFVMSQRLGGLEADVRALAAAAGPVIDHAQPMDGPFHRLAEFKSVERRPGDLQELAGYPAAVSLEWPMYKLLPDAPYEGANELAQRLQWLRPQVRETFRGQTSTGALEAEMLTGDHDVHRVLLSVDMGLYMVYPGHAGVPDAYDPRAGDWADLLQDAPRWGAPRIDALSDALVLPLATPIQGEAGEDVGFVALEMNARRLASELLDPAYLPAGADAYLVDGEGHILLSQETGMGPGVEVASLPYPEARRALGEGLAGQVTLPDGALVTFSPVGAQDWRLVVALSAEEVDARLNAAPTAVASRPSPWRQ